MGQLQVKFKLRLSLHVFMIFVSANRKAEQRLIMMMIILSQQKRKKGCFNKGDNELNPLK